MQSHISHDNWLAIEKPEVPRGPRRGKVSIIFIFYFFGGILFTKFQLTNVFGYLINTLIRFEWTSRTRHISILVKIES